MFATVTAFRSELYACLLSRGDALFELYDALLWPDGPVRTPADLALDPSTGQTHALYSGLNPGRIDVARLRRALVGVPLPQAADGRLPHLRPGRAARNSSAPQPR
ncbi:transposase [Streptomyces sp. NPDC059928]|uniref:transposase n=1 Tax=unclassified Streptomyces TaxID=2593676 RepID=UPI0036564BC4